MDHQKVLEAWKLLCTEHTAYFDLYADAVKQADRNVTGRIKYGQDSVFSQAIGDWCQEFWLALPDTPTIRTRTFFIVCDIAEWHMYGDDE